MALVEGYKTVYLCHLDSYAVTVCYGYLVSSHVVTVQFSVPAKAIWPTIGPAPCQFGPKVVEKI